MPLNEQQEAELADYLKRSSTFSLRSPTFKARKEFYDALLEKGMPKYVADALVGKMLFVVTEESYGGAIYDQLLEVSVCNLFDLWQLYKNELSEEVFLNACSQYRFHPPVIKASDDNAEKPE